MMQCKLLIDYNWSGNIRELINVVKRLMALYKDKNRKGRFIEYAGVFSL